MEIDGVKISQLSKATGVTDNDLIPGVVGGSTQAIKVGMLKTEGDLVTVTEFNKLWKEA